MTKILYTQDEHCSGKNSINYIGDYWKDNMVMVDECLEIAKKNKCSTWISGGDFLHSVQIENHLLDEFIDKIEKQKIDFYFLYGNHNEYYKNKELTRNKSSLAHAERRSKYFKYFEGFGHRDEKWWIEPYDYYFDIETDLKKDEIYVDDLSKMCNPDEVWKIAIVHAFICPEKFPFATHAVCDDIKTNADIVLVAHYHKQWEKKVGNTLYKDIGCFGRRSITEAEIEPTCLIIDTEKREIEEIKLKSAKKPEEIFDIKKVKEIKESNKSINDFIKSVESTEFQSTNIKDMIKEIAKKQNIDKKITDLIFEKIGEV